MTQEEKDLLLKALCEQLPYGVKVERNGDVCKVLGIIDDNIILTANVPTNQQTKIVNIKPYLRPMSSMTDEEWEEFEDLIIPVDGGNAVIEEEKIQNYIEFCLKHHFDYRGLINKGLALEASKDMYKN